MKDYYRDGMIGLITGDAVGMPVQFQGRNVRKKDPVTDMRDHGCFNMPRGAWTDDSSLALATLYSIRKQGSLDLDDIAGKFVLWLKDGYFTPHGRAYDIGMGCMMAIKRYIYKGDVYSCGGSSERDNGNGSLMRILPVCIYAYEQYSDGIIDIDGAVKHVEDVSALTHAHAVAKMACGIYFFLVKSLMECRAASDVLSGGDVSLKDLLFRGITEAQDYYAQDISKQAWLSVFGRLFDTGSLIDLNEDEINSSGYVIDSIEAAVWSLLNTENYRDCILKAVNLGGDTDSIAAIAGGLAGLYYGYDGIPADWSDSLMRKKWIDELCDFSFPISEVENR